MVLAPPTPRNRWVGGSAAPLPVFIASFIVLLVNLTQLPRVYDEGMVAYGAERVLRGAIPYRDFWTLYPPGQFYLVAGLFKLFGPSLLVERLGDTTVRALLATMVFLLGRRLASAPAAIVSWAFTVLWLVHVGYYGYPVFPALLLNLIAVRSLLGHVASPERPGPVFLAGLSVGLASCFRHDLGLYGCVAILLTLALGGPALRARLAPTAPRPRWHPVTLFGLGVAVVLVPVAGGLLLTVAPRDLAHDLITIPVTVFPRVRALSFPPLFRDPRPLLTGELSPAAYGLSLLAAMPFYMQLAVYAAGLMVIVRRLPRARQDPDRVLPLLLLWLVGVTALNQALIRSDLIHLPQALLPATILWTALDHDLRAGTSGPRRAIARGVTLTCLALLLVPPLHSTLLKVRYARPKPLVVTPSIDRARGIWLDDMQARAIQYVQDHSRPQDPLFVGNARHDVSVINDVMFYFLAARSCATRFHELHPGVTTTAPVQEEIVRDIRARSVNLVVIVSDLVKWHEPNESSVSSGVVILDRFLRSDYRLVVRFGRYGIWRRIGPRRSTGVETPAPGGPAAHGRAS